MGKKQRQQRQIELLKHFDGDFYQEKEVGNQWYVKQYNGTTDKWQVAVFTNQSFRNYKGFQDKNRRPEIPDDNDIQNLALFKEELDKKLSGLFNHH